MFKSLRVTYYRWRLDMAIDEQQACKDYLAQVQKTDHRAEEDLIYLAAVVRYYAKKLTRAKRC